MPISRRSVKITDIKIIKDSEKEFIDTITGDLNWDSIEQIIKEKHHFTLQDDIEYRNGDIIVHNNEVAYRLNFNVKVSLSVVFNRQGECIDIETDGDGDVIEGALQDQNGDGNVMSVKDDLNTLEKGS